MGLSYWDCKDGVARSDMSFSVVWYLVPASIDISLKSWGEYIVPTPLKAVLMVEWVSWQAILCVLMKWLL